MYPVSDKYIEAMRAPVREDRITGGIRLKDGTIIAVDDTVIIQKSLTVTRRVSNSSKFDIGTVNSAEMRLKIRDDEAYDHDFGGAAISLKYGVVTAVAEDGTKTWEDVPLPPFYVDGGEAARKRNMVSLIAHDTLSRLTVDKGSPPTTSLFTALQYFCGRCNVGIAISESSFNALPNADIIPDFSAESIQTCWDGVMWIAQTLNCCAFADYRGLVQLKQYKYEGGNSYDRLITGKERTTIEYSDTRTYLAYLQSYEGGDVKLYSKVSKWAGTDAPHTKEGALCLPKNPIVQALTAEQQAAINNSYLNNRSYPTRYIKASGVSDPAIEPYDVIAFSGGNIDIGQIISVATQVTWKFRNGGTIYCANVDEYADTADDTSAQSASGIAVFSADGEVAPQSDDTTLMRTQPKSQLEKQIDELRAGMGKGGTAEKLQTSNTPYWSKTESWGVSFGKNSTPFAYIHEGSGTTGFELRGYGSPCLNMNGSTGAILAQNGSTELNLTGGARVVMGDNAQIFIDSSDMAFKCGNTLLQVAKNVQVSVDSGGELEIIASGKPSLRISASSDGFCILSGSAMLEAKSNGLYYNGEKVLTED